METYELSESFQIGTLYIVPVHMRIEQLPPVIAAHTHSNTSFEIHYTVSGRGTVAINGETYQVTPDTLYITGPRIVHVQISEPAAPVLEHCLYLYCQRTSQAPDDPFSLFVNTAFWIGLDQGRVAPLLKRLIEENRDKHMGYREMSETLLHQIVILLMRMYRQGEPQRPAAGAVPPLTRASLMPILEDAFFYRYQTLTLDSLARLLNLSTRQIQRLLQQYFDKTFSQKLTEARMAAAAQFLVNTDLSVTEISDRVGFSSIEHFSTAFRRFEGLPPRAYRQLHKKEAGKTAPSPERG